MVDNVAIAKLGAIVAICWIAMEGAKLGFASLRARIQQGGGTPTIVGENGNASVRRIDCLKTQIAIKESIQEEMQKFRKDLQDSLKEFSCKIDRHELRYHKENSGVHTILKK